MKKSINFLKVVDIFQKYYHVYKILGYEYILDQYFYVSKTIIFLITTQNQNRFCEKCACRQFHCFYLFFDCPYSMRTLLELSKNVRKILGLKHILYKINAYNKYFLCQG